METSTNTNRETGNRQTENYDPPLSLVEVLTAEYEHQNRINGWQSPLTESGKSSIEGFYEHLHKEAKEPPGEKADEKCSPVLEEAFVARLLL